MNDGGQEHPGGTERWPVRCFAGTSWRGALADIVREVPLSLWLDGRKLATIACTGLHVEELALGWLRGEGIIRSAAEITALVVEPGGESVHVSTRNGATGGGEGDRMRRRDEPWGVAVVSPDTAGGVDAAVAGTASGAGPDGGVEVFIAAAGGRSPFRDPGGVTAPPGDSEKGTAPVPAGAAGGLPPLVVPSRVPPLSPSRIFDLMEQLTVAVAIHRLSRGTHGAALADERGIIVVREDIGRHNCLDMLSGYALRHGLDGADKILLRTGRVSSEIVYKLWRMGVPVALSLSVPTALAVRIAEAAGITLVGAIRTPSLTVYTHPERIGAA